MGRQYAVLIGIDRYKSWPALRNPVKDARQIKEILDRRYYIDQFMELYDGDASKAAIIRLFGGLIETTRPEDSVMIFYSGHGFLDPMSNTGFWIPVDGGVDRYAQENWIPNAQIRGFIGRMKARHVALVADSCFSGDILDPTRGAAPDIVGEYFRNAYKRVSRQVLTSGASEAVPDSSPFALQLRLALEGNRRPYLDPLMLYDEIRLGVAGTTPLFGSLKEAGHQEGGSFLLFLKDAAAPSAPAGAGPAAGPTVIVRKAYGSIEVEARTAGDLYLDGALQVSVLARGGARIDNVEAGLHAVGMRYKDSESETHRVSVQRDGTAVVEFVYVPQVLDMMYVQGGTFLMGDASKEADDDEKPVHQVTVGGFFLSRHEVTFEQYDRFCDETGRDPPGDEGWGRETRPVVNVSWLDAAEFCNWLSENEGLAPFYTISGGSVSVDDAADGYRLPTEAEWEYAAGGGAGSGGTKYAGGEGLDEVAWHKGNAGGTTHPVGEKEPNELGLYDMSGNVWEWCNDWYSGYAAEAQDDPQGPDSGGDRIVRGGSWYSEPREARVSYRATFGPADHDNDLGFRPARPDR